MENTIAGLYKHYKGNLYLVFGVGKNTETEEEYVIYRSFMDPNGNFHVRPKDMFFSMVSNEDEVFERFAKLSEEEAIAEVGILLEDALGTDEANDALGG